MKKENNSIISLENISKSYTSKERKISILENIMITFETGKLYAIMGHSGSGKSTLINILGLMDNIDEGKYFLYDENTKEFNENKLADMRMKHIGFIFQDFQLNPNLKAIENVIVPMMINPNIEKKHRQKKAFELLDDLGLKERVTHFPRELSGGEQQRVAIARALANDPDIILADEPTGNLDETKEQEIFQYLRKFADNGKCVIVVSHSKEIKKYADKIYSLKNRTIVGEDD